MDKRNKSVSFFSSNPELCRGFYWAKNQALAYVIDDAPVGPCYEAALPGRDAFCMRDVSHQSVGAHYLGLQRHNRNMMRVFAGHIREERDFCSYWEITSEGLPAPIDYTDDTSFWYNLPANFDVTSTCNRLYDLTGDQGYLTDPVMANFHRMTVENYARRWDRDRDGIVDRVDSDGRRGIASYDEANTKGYSVAADALATQCAAYAAAARMYSIKGEPELAAPLQAKADHLAAEIETKWWNPEENHLNTFRMKDGSYKSILSGINTHMPLHFNVIRKPEQIEGQLDCLIAIEPELNVEDRSYVPAILWRYGRDEAAMKVWLKMTARSYARREYPEVSFASIDALITGYMGLIPDASRNLVRTRSAAADGEWAEIFDAPLWGGSIDLRHDGKTASELTNRTGRALTWEAAFNGCVRTAQVLPGETVRLEA